MTDVRIQPRPGRSTALCANRLLAATCCSLTLLLGAPGIAAAQSNSSEQSTTSSMSAPTPAPIGGVIAGAIQDFRQIPSWTNIAILAAGGLGAAFAHPTDMGVSQTLSPAFCA